MFTLSMNGKEMTPETLNRLNSSLSQPVGVPTRPATMGLNCRGRWLSNKPIPQHQCQQKNGYLRQAAGAICSEILKEIRSLSSDTFIGIRHGFEPTLEKALPTLNC